MSNLALWAKRRHAGAAVLVLQPPRPPANAERAGDVQPSRKKTHPLLVAARQREFEGFLRLLPHQYPFLLVDRVLELDRERTLTLKNVTINEQFFTGHFPGSPIMPGVLILEALAQSAAILALSIIGERRSLFMLTGIDKARMRRRVVPGDQLKMEVW